RLVDVVEGVLKLLDLDGGAGRLALDVTGLLPEHLGGRLDEVAGGGIQRGDLVEHQLLAVQGQGGHDRGAKRRHGGRGGPVHALDQLEIVLADEVQGQVALNVHGEL